VKVGTAVSIKFASGSNDKNMVRYRSKVLDRNEKVLIIGYPVNEQLYVELPFKEGDEVKIEYIDKGNVYSFQSKVKRLIKSPFMSFVIDIPNKDEIKRIQRREYVRINTDVNVAVHGIDRNFPPFITVTHDISGGGAAIITPKGISLQDGEMVMLYLVLKSKYSDYVYIKTKAEVIRSQVINDVRMTSLKFHFKEEKERQAVIKYCFEIQRERLKENLM